MCTYIFIYIYTYTCISIYIFVYLFIQIDVYIPIRTYLFIFLYIYSFKFANVYINIHIHKHLGRYKDAGYMCSYVSEGVSAFAKQCEGATLRATICVFASFYMFIGVTIQM